MDSTSELLTGLKDIVSNAKKNINKNNMYKRLCAISKNRRRCKAVECVLCEEKFVHTHSYEDHMLYVHDKFEYPLIYECEHCSRKFKFKHHLSSHVRKHDGSTRFPCKRCQETFVTKKNRRAHIRAVHTRSNIYQCCECTNAFQSESSLHSHMKNVHRINLYMHNCNKCFALCEYKSAAFVKPAQKPIVNFVDTIFEHKELSEMIKARRCGDIIKLLYENNEVIEDAPQEITKHNIRTVRTSIRKFFSFLRDAKNSKKHGANRVMASGSTTHNYEGDSTRAIVIDSVVSLSNNVPNVFDKSLVIKIERIDQVLHSDQEYVEDLTSIKSEPIDSELLPYSSKVYNIHMMNGSNQYLWPRPDNFVSQNLSVNMNHEQTDFQKYVSKTSVSPKKSQHSTIMNSSDINDLVNGADDSISIYQCKYCISKFTTERSLANHVARKHFSILLAYKCKKCYRIFNSKPQLVKHMTQTHNSEMSCSKHKCMFCAKTFKLRIQANQHVINNHNNLIKCSECHNLSDNFFSLKRHMKIVHNHSTLYKCEICEAIFTYRNELKQHFSDNKHLYKCDYCDSNFERSLIVRLLKVNTNKKIFYKCKVCRYDSNVKMCEENSSKFRFEYRANKNVSGIANKNLHAIKPSVLNRKKYSQDIPEIPEGKSVNKSELNLKQLFSNRKPKTPNLHCESSVVNSKTLVSIQKSSNTNLSITDIRSPISVSDPSISNEKPLLPYKGSAASSQHTNKQDMLVPDKALELDICPSCRTLYSSNENFFDQIHQKNIEISIKSIDNDSTEKNVSSKMCLICNATLPVGTERHNLLMNLHKPIEVKMFKCVVCNQLFTMRITLMSHMRLRHEKYLKSHQCVQCDIIFKETESLEKHRQRKHITNIDDCITLGKSDWSETSPLKKIDSQMRIIRINAAPKEDKTIDLSKLLKCDHCSALFKLKSSLQSHIQLEHMPKVTLHKCCLCRTVFYRITDLDRHLRNKHQLDMELYSQNKDPTNFNLKWKKILTHTYEIEKM